MIILYLKIFQIIDFIINNIIWNKRWKTIKFKIAKTKIKYINSNYSNWENNPFMGMGGQILDLSQLRDLTGNIEQNEEISMIQIIQWCNKC